MTIGINIADSSVAYPKVPQSLADVDNGKILGFGQDLAEDHPGYHDPSYKQRRIDICNLAKTHKIGRPIPRIEYTKEEQAVWSKVMQELLELYPHYACKEYLRTFPMFNFTPYEVPQLEDLNATLKKTTGFKIRPVAGLLHPRDFLNGLAFETFHSTQFLRHPSSPTYTPEPDLLHEALGHVPMLADPNFVDLVKAIGVASLGADDKTIWKLGKLYWYTVEFGVVREGNDVKAFGAGILSSYGEMRNMAEGKAELLPFDPFAKQPAMSYKDGYQKQYFVLESFEDGAAKLREYCEYVQKGLPDDVKAKVESAVARHELLKRL